MSPLLRLSLLAPLLSLCLLQIGGLCDGAPNLSDEDIAINPRPYPQERDIGLSNKDSMDMMLPADFQPEDDGDRYVGYCANSYVRMIPGNTRKFWSYGYVLLQEAYPPNCTLKYVFTTKSNPSDGFAKYGFRITGSFVGPNVVFTDCSETDYVTIDDTEGTTATYCGTNATIDFTTGSNYFEFTFVSQEFSPGALGFFVTIHSYYLCGGLITSSSHGPTGYISSPLFADEYPANSNCAWWFTSSEESTIKMECNSFLLEDWQTFDNGTSYCPDYLSISYEAITPTETSIFCNSDMNTLSRTIYSAGNSLLATFRTDSVNHYSGFNCSYDFIMFSV